MAELFDTMNERQYLRRMPVYLLLDTSISMRLNNAIDGLRAGVAMLITTLNGIPEAAGTVHIKVITFDERVTATNLVPLAQFHPPQLDANGNATYLGMALRRLDEDARFGHDLEANTAQRKGDLLPIVLILTDGQPNDPGNEFATAAAAIKRRVTHRELNIIAVACGPMAPPNTLKEITDNVLVMHEMNAERMQSLMQWFSQSLAIRSQAASRHIGGGDPPPTPMAPPPPGIVLF